METDKIIELCKSGNLNDAQKFYNENKDNINLYAKNVSVFGWPCYRGHIDILKWLYDIDRNIINKVDKLRAFTGACVNGHIEIAKWLYEIYDKNIDIHYNDNLIFTYCCRNNHPQLIQWLNEIKTQDLSPKNRKLYELFCYIAKNGYLEVFQLLTTITDLKLYTLNYTNMFNSILPLNKNMLVYSYMNKHNIFYDYLCAKYNISENIIQKIKEEAFIELCKTGRKEDANEIYQINKFDNNTMIQLFEKCCMTCNLEIIQWIYSLIDSKFSLQQAATLCRFNKKHSITILKWLYSLDNTIKITEYMLESYCDMYINNIIDREALIWINKQIIKQKILISSSIANRIFIKSCKFGCIWLAKMIYKNGAQYDCDNDEAFKQCCKNYQFYTKIKNSINGPIKLKPTTKDKILYSYNHRSKYCIEIAKWLASLDQNYYLKIKKDRIKKFTVVLKGNDIIKAYHYKLDEYYQKNAKEIENNNELCSLCLDDINVLNKWVQLSCKHMQCIECFIHHKICSFGCKINIQKTIPILVKSTD